MRDNINNHKHIIDALKNAGPRKTTYSFFKRETRICPATGEEFIPKRYNQTYINSEVQIKHNNLQARLKNSDLKKLNDSIKSNAKKLEKLYKFMIENNSDCISAEYLKYEKVNTEIYLSKEKNYTTLGVVYWNLDYGFEPVDETLIFYYLHKKQKP